MVGSGYVGLVSGAYFADFGCEVVCIDKDQSKIDRLHENAMPIYEPGLDALVESIGPRQRPSPRRPAQYLQPARHARQRVPVLVLGAGVRTAAP